MKRNLRSIFALICWAFTAGAQVPSLELHHIGSGDGDATLIMAIDSTNVKNIKGQAIWDTCVVLIDGQRSGGGKEVWRYVSDTISTRFPTRLKIDYLVLSHLHIDHYGGLTNLITEAVAKGWKINGFVSRMVVPLASVTNAGGEIDTCYSNISLNVAVGSRLRALIKAVTDNKIPTPALTVNDDLFYKNNFVNISMKCIVGLGTTYTADGKARYTFLPQNADGTYTAKSENDLSYGWLFSFQGFHYTSFGDLGGINTGNYVDGESFVTKYLLNRFNNKDYHLCVHKVSHHGSAESTTTDFAKANNISLAVIPACLRSYGSSQNPLPTQTAIVNLQGNPGSTYIGYTFMPYHPGLLQSYWTYKNLQYYNDYIIKVTGGPGYPAKGSSLPFTIIQHLKNLDYSYAGPPVLQPFSCTKGHQWLSAVAPN